MDLPRLLGMGPPHGHGLPWARARAPGAASPPTPTHLPTHPPAQSLGPRPPQLGQTQHGFRHRKSQRGSRQALVEQQRDHAQKIEEIQTASGNQVHTRVSRTCGRDRPGGSEEVPHETASELPTGTVQGDCGGVYVARRSSSDEGARERGLMSVYFYGKV